MRAPVTWLRRRATSSATSWRSTARTASWWSRASSRPRSARSTATRSRRAVRRSSRHSAERVSMRAVAASITSRARASSALSRAPSAPRMSSSFAEGAAQQGEHLLADRGGELARRLEPLERAREAQYVRHRNAPVEAELRLQLPQGADERRHELPGRQDALAVASRDHGLHHHLDTPALDGPADPLPDLRLERLQAPRNVERHVEEAVVEAAHRHRRAHGAALEARRAEAGHRADHTACPSGVNWSSWRRQ